MNDSVRVSVEIALDPQAAFERFTRGMMQWWPKDYSWSGEVLEDITIDPVQGGLCTERGPFGFRCDFGRVLVVEPGESIIFTWQISSRREPIPDPSKAGKVAVSFVSTKDNQTTVTLTHSDFANYGEGFESYRDAMASDYGWPLLMQRFANV